MPASQSLATGQPAAEKAGADLRAARERLGWSLNDVAASLCIRVSHLEALEKGHVSRLPGNAYALGFVRSYARALGLDAKEMVRRFKTEANAGARQTELVFPVPMPGRGPPAGAVVLVGLALTVGAYAAWYHLSGEGRLPAETVAAIPERLASLADQALPLAPDRAAVSEAPAQAAPQLLLAEPAAPLPYFSPTSAAAAPIPLLVPDQAPTSQVAGLASNPADNAPTEANRIVLHANADAWVQVKDHAGAILLTRTLKAGEAWPVPTRPDLLLTTGNAGGTEILLDGTPIPSLGRSGIVRRDIPLAPDLIKDGRFARNPAPDLASVRAHQ